MDLMDSWITSIRISSVTDLVSHICLYSHPPYFNTFLVLWQPSQSLILGLVPNQFGATDAPILYFGHWDCQQGRDPNPWIRSQTLCLLSYPTSLYFNKNLNIAEREICRLKSESMTPM